MRTIFFNNINLLNLPIILFFRLIGFDVFFLKVSRKLRSKFFIKTIKTLGIEWYNYQNHEYKNPHSNIVVPSIKIANLFSKKITDLSWSKNLEFYLLDKQNLNICLRERFINSFANICEIYAIANHYKKNEKKIYIWLTNNSLSSELARINKTTINLCPKLLTILNTLFGYFYNFLYLFLVKIFKKFASYTETNNKNKKFNKTNLEAYKVCFFPHKGVNSQNYKRNYFYSQNKKSIFHPSNILHLEWSKNDIVNNIFSLKFYKENNIKVLFWENVFSKKYIIDFKILFLFIKILLPLLKKVSLNIILEIFIILLRVEMHKKKLLNFPNLKIVLVGYDALFPQPLAVACRLENISLVAAQERTMIPVGGSQYLLDKYFIIGPQSKKDLENRIDKKMKLIETGLVKITQHLEEGKEIKILSEKNFKLKSLVMDYNSVKSWYQNGRLYTTNWKKNLNFYNTVINLAKKNKEILFLIKSKNYLWLEIGYFEKAVNELRQLENVEILSDYKTWSPSNCIKSVDFGIALMTSLADEMLAIGKPVIIYEPEDFPSCLLDYGPSIISKNFEDLNNKVKSIKLNLQLYNNSLNQIREKFYKKFNKEYFLNEINKLSQSL